MADDLRTLEAELGDRLRHTLRTVADNTQVTDAPPLARRRWRRMAGVAVAAIISVGSAAAFMAQNDDAIVRLPVEQALMSGRAASGEWWLFPTDAVGGCPKNPGVVLVAEEINKPGNELNAGGVSYGEPPRSNVACAPHDEAAWLDDPGRTDIGYSRLGFEHDDTPWGVYGTFHPTVRAIRVNADNAPPFVIDTVSRHDRPDGPRFVAFSLPADTHLARLELLGENGTSVRDVLISFG